MTLNRSWLLASRPDGPVKQDDFGYREEAFSPPDLAAGEIFVATRIFSCAPTIRNWLNPPGRSYRGAIGIGDPIRGMAAVEVVASRHNDFAPGDLVTAVAAWQDYTVLAPDKAAVPITHIPAGIDVADAMTIYSPNTLTAYFGLLAVGEPRPGMTVLVSGAAGSVGAMVCQMALIAGCRVIALAGGADKCRWLEETCGVEIAIDYRLPGLADRLKEACPDGIDIFFDNVGGDALQKGIDQMAPHGRVVLCGQISAYDTGQPAPGPADMMKLVYGRIRMEGFVIGDFADRYEEAYSRIRAWHRAGKIRCRVDMREGFSALPEAFVDLFQGKNVGTLLVRNVRPK